MLLKNSPKEGAMKRNRILIALIFVVCGFAVYGYGRYVAFPSPENCKACHYIKPYYDKWATSTHKMVPCLKCHVYTMEKAVASQFLFLAGSTNPRPSNGTWSTATPFPARWNNGRSTALCSMVVVMAWRVARSSLILRQACNTVV